MKSMPDRDINNWYQKLQKPTWAPPSYLFGPVWSFLYVLITISFVSVFVKWLQGDFQYLIALPFMLNLVFNIIFSPIQFKLKNNMLACIDIALVLGTLIWAMIMIRTVEPWIFFIQIPYLLWVSFATVLQIEITWLNRKLFR